MCVNPEGTVIFESCNSPSNFASVPSCVTEISPSAKYKLYIICKSIGNLVCY